MMDARDYRAEIEGFTEIQREVEVLQKYGFDYLTQKGKVGQVIKMLHPKRLSLRVSEIRQETRTTKTFRLVSAEAYLPPFQAGQYINLFVQAGGVRTSRPYSIASPPNQTGYYEITVRRVEDGFVSSYLLDAVRVGDEFESTSPSGNFFHNPLFHGDDLVFLAGGSGITPFMSMIREVTDRGLKRHIHLIYGCQRPDDIIFQEELEGRRRRHDHLQITPVISDPPPGHLGLTGFITANLIRKTLGNVSPKTFYVCGPEEMYALCLPELEKLGVPKTRIRLEVFGPPQDVTTQPGWPGDLSRDATFNLKVIGGRTIAARAGEPMMVSLEKAGIPVPASCRSGECSLCRTKLVAGKVFQPQRTNLRKSDRLFGYIHPCLAYPLEDCEIMI